MKCATLKVLNLAVVCAIIMKYILVYYLGFSCHYCTFVSVDIM